MPYTGPQIKDYGTVAELTATHQLLSGVAGPSASLLAFSGHTTPNSPPSTTTTTPTTTVAATHTTATTPTASGPAASTGPLTTVSPGSGGPSGGGPAGPGAGAHGVPGPAGGKLPYTGLSLVGETLLGAGAVVSGFVARRFSKKPSSK